MWGKKEQPLETVTHRMERDEKKTPSFAGYLDTAQYWKQYDGVEVEVSTPEDDWTCYITAHTAQGVHTVDDDGVEKFFPFTAIRDIQKLS